jgi:hypothetical protein
MEILGAILLVLVIILGASQNWKLSIKTILVLVVVEGALRRWVFPQARDLIYFFKDFILIGSYVGFASRPRLLIDRFSWIKELTFVIAILCILQAFNPSLGSPIVGLIGIRAYLLYIPLLWVIPHLFESGEELRNFLRWYFIILIPVCILGIFQYYAPPDSIINVYGIDGAAANASVGEFVRITGTFSYLAGHTSYLAFCFSLLVVLIAREQTLKWQLIYGLELILVAANSFMSGARFIIIYEGLFITLYLLLLIFTSSRNAFSSIKRLSVIMAITAIATIVYFQPAIQAFSDRAVGSDSTEERIIDSITQVFDYGSIRLDGYGTGATQSSVLSLRSVLALPAGEVLPTSEGETGRVLIEIGLLGFILWYGLRIIILVSLYITFSRLRNPFYKELCLAVFLFHLINITGQLITNPTMLVYFWFLGGFIYLLPILEEKEMFMVVSNEADTTE